MADALLMWRAALLLFFTLIFYCPVKFLGGKNLYGLRIVLGYIFDRHQ